VLRKNGITSYNGKAIVRTDIDVTDIQRTFAACGIFLCFIIYKLNDGGIGSLLSSQGSTLPQPADLTIPSATSTLWSS
jgi:hypothetical protein